jgi:ATP-dependent Clp protease adaptor protein ClpS|tara:strand:+ start:414 stop:725 length:312 start_codon:yes stop_codon:yes gene_type:complete
MSLKTESNVKIKPNVKLPEPPMFKIIYINDDLTTIEFVIQSLITHFSYTDDTASNITRGIHTEGSAVVAVMPYEIAEQKGIEVTLEAREQGFPLQVKIEAEAS